MTVNRFLAVFGAVCLCALPPFAQPAKAESPSFEEIKARAEKGDAQAQLELGSAYATGTGVELDAKKAVKWYRKAAGQGLARAQYRLSLTFAAGEGVKPDLKESLRWLRKAAEQGLAEAQFAIGQRYANGDGVEQNEGQAARWFRKAADQGLVEGEDEVGNSYLEGRGAPKDIEEGIKWIRRAAERGFAPAQNTLGLCCQKGIGVPKDNVEAYKWFNLAAAKGDAQTPDIRVNLAKIETLLTKEQIAEAQRLAREFHPTQNPPPATTTTAAESAKLGFVTVKADDETCEVLADGAFVGNPPARLKLAEGTHIIEVKKPGYRDYRREIKVGAGADLTLRATLEKQ